MKRKTIGTAENPTHQQTLFSCFCDIQIKVAQNCLQIYLYNTDLLPLKIWVTFQHVSRSKSMQIICKAWVGLSNNNNNNNNNKRIIIYIFIQSHWVRHYTNTTRNKQVHMNAPNTKFALHKNILLSWIILNLSGFRHNKRRKFYVDSRCHPQNIAVVQTRAR